MAESLENVCLETLAGPDSDSGAKSRSEMPDSPPSSDSSDDDYDGEENEELKLEALEKELKGNPYNYDAHVQYIKSLRKLGHIEKLREAREEMSSLFPLSHTMWQEWAKDEISLSTGSEAYAAVEKLYERGLQEYLFVPLWCDYIEFVEKYDMSVSACTPAGISKMRDLFERALTAAGIHVVEGNKIWEAYREFEQALFLTIDESDVEEKAKQVQRIRSLFHRQLSVPLSTLRSTLLSYRIWEAEHGNIREVNSEDFDGVPSHVVSAYEKAMQMYNTRVPYEDRLSIQNMSDTERFQHFMTYIKFEESCGDPAHVQILYERTVTEFPISSDIWLGYTRYLDRKLKVHNVLRSVYSRATKNCTCIGELWSRYLLSLERVGAPEEELSAVFEQSLQCVFSSIEEYLDLFLIRVDGLRRRICLTSSVDNGLKYAMIRGTFQRAAEYLSPLLKNTDTLLRLHAYWARLELKLGQDLAAARGVWESLIKTSGSMLEVWQYYIAMEIEAGHINEARSIYKRCYSKRFPGTGSEDICYSWLRFEREFGSLEDFDLAERKVTPRLEELLLFRSQQEFQSTTAASAIQRETQRNASQKRKSSSTKSTDAQSSPKRQKDTQQKQSRGPTQNRVQKDTLQQLNNGNENLSVTLSDASDLPEKAVEPKVFNEQPSGDVPSRDAKLNFYTDQCTVFISNLSLKANEEHLRDFFSGIGGITAIRLLRDKFTGRSRGLAYVDFSDDEHLAAAVAKNKQKLLGQKLNIAHSDPKKSQKRASSGSNAARGRGRSLNGGDRESRLDSKEAAEGILPRNAAASSSSVSHRRGQVQLTGKNTFAMPRSVARPLGWSNDQVKDKQSEEEKPKSNDEFRKMLMKK